MMKSKKNLARKILCGLLTAGVVGVSGSAMAATTYGYNTKTDTDDINNVINAGNISDVDYGIYYEKKTGLELNKDSIDIAAKQFGICGKYNGEFTINATNELKIAVSTDSVNKVYSIYTDPVSKNYPLNKLTLNAGIIELNAKGSGEAYGINAKGGQTSGKNYISEIIIGSQNTKKITISSEGTKASGIYMSKNASVIANADDITINSIGTSASGVSNNGNASTLTSPTKAELSLTAGNSINISAKAAQTASAVTSSGYYSETKLKATSINLEAENTSESGDVYAIRSKENSKLTLTGKNVIISSKSTSTNNTSAYGIHSEANAITTINSDKIAIASATGDTNSYAVYNDNATTNIGNNNAEVKLTSFSKNGMAASVVSSGSKKNSNVDILGQNIDIGAEGSYAYGLHAIDGNKINIGSSETAVVDVIANGKDDAVGIYAKKSGEINVVGNTLNIKATSDKTVAGISVQNNTTTASDNLATVNIKTAKTVINAQTGIAAYSQGIVNLNDGDVEINAEKAIETRGHATTNINQDGTHTVKLNGDIDFNVTNDGNSGLSADANVNINLTNADSYFTGSINKTEPDNLSGVDMKVTGMTTNISNGAAWNMTGDSFVNNATVSDGGAINVQDDVNNFDVQNSITLNNGNLNLQGNEQNVTIANLNGAGGIVNTNSVNNAVSVTNIADNTKVKVNGTSEVTDKIASGSASLQDLANVVKGANAEDNKSLASKVTSDANDIVGGYSADVDNNGNVVTQSIQAPENPTNRAISDMASISLMTWRQENNDMNKRLGELRDSNGEHGAWARMARGESKYGAQNVKNQYNYYQVGYDEKLSVNPNWTVGVALTRTEGNSTFATGSGENKHTGFAVYGSYLNDNGSFIDLIAKYARMDNEYKTVGAGVGNADYETNGYSLSAEYGKRFTKDNGFWIEPQVELTYGTVGSASYTTSKGATVYQEGVDSLVGRLGFSLGKNIKQGNVYVRASYLYDFDGETKAMMSKAGAGSYSFEQDLGGGWWEVGVGTNLNLSEATHLYFDVEKTYGGNVATPWQWNAGVRWSF